MSGPVGHPGSGLGVILSGMGLTNAPGLVDDGAQNRMLRSRPYAVPRDQPNSVSLWSVEQPQLLSNIAYEVRGRRGDISRVYERICESRPHRIAVWQTKMLLLVLARTTRPRHGG
jgi:hypothetical protein